ncbi:MAG TPA: hypothetical protein VMS18_18360 [Candidatus Binatia bacterium]|nr:hypothetical protein [Candidatus Binatia bacterium]
MTHWNQLAWALGLLLVASSVELARAADPPSDLCSLLPSATVNKTLGSTYSSPKATVAPRPFPNTNQGTDCAFESGGHTLLFRIYVDPSPSASADLFAKLKTYFGSGSTAVTGVGDEAYLDKLHGLHVRKGKVRFFLDGAGTPKQKSDLAVGIAGQL